MRIKKIKIIKNNKGYIYKIFKKNTFEKGPIKELYFNQIESKKETQWIKHKKSTCNIYVTNGSAKLFIQKKTNKINRIKINELSDKKIIIKPNTWFKIVNIMNKKLVFLNYTDYVHDKNENEKKEKI